MSHDIRDQLVDFVSEMSQKTEISRSRFVGWLRMSRSKYYDWQLRYGKANEHNRLVPRDWWLEGWEREAIVQFFIEHPFDGYRRLCYMMLDSDIVAVSPSTVYRVLSQSSLLGKKREKTSVKGNGFVQPLKAHAHWHIDVTYLNIGGTFYYMCSILDGFSRYIVHWEIRESMKERDIEIIIQRAREKFPGAFARVISDNGPQFMAKDFKEFLRFCGMSHVRTSPYYPQSNGKLERMHGTLKRECIRPKCPGSLEEAREIVAEYVEYYNTKRLHSAIGYVTPQDILEGRQAAIHQARDRKLEQARQRRKERRQSKYRRAG